MSLDRRQIRAFLSSTFSDFQEERDLLAKQVFPALRQKAKGRGVQVVDVDLRWGITEEQSQQGQTLPICLAEIDNCRPYFIGLLGERYGWVPDADHFSPELLERQAWLREHQGGTSVTELEILHGVLNTPAMTGRAFFYFRDPAYSTARAEAGEPGWRSEGEQERQKLEALKQRIRTSGFPVVEGLASPQAIAERIEADLWALIEEQFPEGEQPDALVIEAARHASYRADRTGLYLGGTGYIDQLEQWIGAGEQRILITGDSGSGKSALIANWMVAHQQSHPEDVVFAHHLGCSSDANAVRPLLARLMDSANRLLAEEQAKPLVANRWDDFEHVSQVLTTLSDWCQRHRCRWIWVLDGLDKLSAEDQQALPWLPITLPPGIQVVATALACPARSILEGRDYRSLVIGPLQRPEQAALIDRYLRIFARQLEAGLKDQLLAHPLAGSPLFLRVLLEELRLCGRFETLGQQLEHYLGAGSIDDLYERVLERLENDGHDDAIRDGLTALWASRAGLSEPELLAIADLPMAAWTPIGIGLKEALGESNGRLVFGHDYLRIAVQDRYAPTDEQRRQVHSYLADWFEAREVWDERDAEEWPWQLQQAGRLEDLRHVLLSVPCLGELMRYRNTSEVLSYWQVARDPNAGELDELIAAGVEEVFKKPSKDPDELILLARDLEDLLVAAGLKRQLLFRLCELLLELHESMGDQDDYFFLDIIERRASVYESLAQYSEAEPLRQSCLKIYEQNFGPDNTHTLLAVSDLAFLYQHKGDYEQAEALYCRALEGLERKLGSGDPHTNSARWCLANVLSDQARYDESITLRRVELEVSTARDGRYAPETLTSIHGLAQDLYFADELEESEQLYREGLQGRIAVLGDDDSDTMTSRYGLACTLSAMGRYEEAIELRRIELAWSRRIHGDLDFETLVSIDHLAADLCDSGLLEEAESLFRELVAGRQQVLDPGDFAIARALGGLAQTLEAAGRLEEALDYAQQALDHRLRFLGADSWITNSARLNLARVLYKLQRTTEALKILEAIQLSTTTKPDQDYDDRALLSGAAELRREIEEQR